MQAIYSALPGRPEFDEEKYRLGSLCNKEHEWMCSGMSLRYVCNGKCIECEKAKHKQNYERYKEIKQSKARERMRKYLSTDEGRERSRESRRRSLAINGRKSEAKGLESLLVPPGQRLSLLEARIARELVANGHPLNFWTLKPLIDQQYLLEYALKDVGRSPSVARLVADEQKRYWKENPEAKAEHDRQRSKQLWWLKYQIDSQLRLYHREKSKRRKARMREVTSIKICPREIRDRFRQFGNCCAYCGCDGDMQIEHVVPIAQGGTHALGNIIPACQRCNTNKRDHDPEMWYCSQPFFSELRWKKICKVLGWDRSGPGQLALL